MSSALLGAPAGVAARAAPVDVEREQARRAALRELSGAEYQHDRESLPRRVLGWLADRVEDLLDAAAGASPGGYAGLAAILALVVVAVVATRARTGFPSRTAATDRSLFAAGRPRT
ncbi:MAG: hypothetical protein M3Q27_14120, partial [Actinomycetota bacterium]|nr:hypothetical protein [Actinomycetota bacterium]